MIKTLFSFLMKSLDSSFQNSNSVRGICKKGTTQRFCLIFLVTSINIFLYIAFQKKENNLGTKQFCSSVKKKLKYTCSQFSFLVDFRHIYFDTKETKPEIIWRLFAQTLIYVWKNWKFQGNLKSNRNSNPSYIFS